MDVFETAPGQTKVDLSQERLLIASPRWTLAPRNSAHDAFLNFTNLGGWPSDGLSMLVGLYPLVFCLLGFDSQVHMGECL